MKESMLLHAIKRREFIRIGAYATLLASFPRLLKAGSGKVDRVSIFHTTDLHGNILPTSTYDGVQDVGGLARCASRLKELRRLYPHNLTIDVGDLYQGTDVSLRSEGQMMINCLNHLDFDAWLVGNHEIDWGIEAVHNAVGSSRMPVLAANVELHGAAVWKEETREKSTLAPYFIKEVNGYRIAVIGLTTPNMANWFLPELTPGFFAYDPVPIMGEVLKEVKAEKPDAIILTCHMGVRPWTTEDDAANRLFALTEAYPEIDAIIAGHTHRDQAKRRVNNIPYTQASYFGIHLGHLELQFDSETKELIRISPTTELMDNRFDLDPEVIALTREEVAASEAHMNSVVGTLEDQLDFQSSPGNPSPYERLICSSIIDGLRRRSIQVDACIHGLLFTDAPLLPGEKTVSNMWTVIPFENFVVTAEVDKEQLKAILEEVYRQRNHRSIVGISPTIEGRGDSLRVTDIQYSNGKPIRQGDRITIALNSYDAASGGSRFPLLRDITESEQANRVLHRLQSRALLIEYFQENSPVGIDRLHT